MHVVVAAPVGNVAEFTKIFCHFGRHHGELVLHPEFIREMLETATHVLLAVDDEGILGIAMLVVDRRLWIKTRKTTLEITVAARRGCGEQLIRKAHEIARENKVALSAEVMGDKLLTHYETKYGFKRKMQTGADSWIMSLDE